MSRALDFPLGHLTLVLRIALLRRHFTGEIPRGDGIDSDSEFLKFRAHEFADVHRGSFGGVVGKMSLGVSHETGHGGNGDDAGTELFLSSGVVCAGVGAGWFAVVGGLQKREERHRGEIYACDVGLEDFLPVRDAFSLPEFLGEFEGVLFRGFDFGTGDSGITDQEVDVVFFFLDLPDEFLEVALGGHVTWSDGDDTAAGVAEGGCHVVGLGFRGRGTVFVGGVFENFHAATCDVDSCSVGGEGLSGH